MIQIQPTSELYCHFEVFPLLWSILSIKAQNHTIPNKAAEQESVLSSESLL